MKSAGWSKCGVFLCTNNEEAVQKAQSWKEAAQKAQSWKEAAQ